MPIVVLQKLHAIFFLILYSVISSKYFWVPCNIHQSSTI